MEMAQKKIFAERLGMLRIDEKLSQQQLSEITGINRETIAKYETIKRIPSFEHLTIFAKYFHTTTDYLLGLTDVIEDDAGIAAACRYTGLSEMAIMTLGNSLDDKSSKVLSDIISDESLLDIVCDIERLGKIRLNEREKADEKSFPRMFLSTIDILRYRIQRQLDIILDKYDTRLQKEASNNGKHTTEEE